MRFSGVVRARTVTATATGALVLTMLSGPAPAVAAALAAPAPKHTQTVHAQHAAPVAKDRADPTPVKPAKVVWPKAAHAVVDLTGRKAGEARAITPSGTVVDERAAGKDAVVAVAPAPAKALDWVGLAPAPAGVDVHVLDKSAAARAGGVGLGVQLTRTDKVATAGKVQVSLDYSGFQHAHGGDFGARLRLMKVPACAVESPRPKDCKPGKPQFVAAKNDPAKGTLTATVPVGGDASGTTQNTPGSATNTPLMLSAQSADTASTYVVAAGSSSDAGDYRATPLRPSGSWNVSQGSGAFTYSLPIQVPAPPTGSAPSLSLTYNSQSVDALTSAENTQAGQEGLGWDMSAGFIERRYRPCASDGIPTVGDLCWDSPNSTTEPDGAIYTINLNGHSSTLVQDNDGTGWYHLQDDPGWRVQHLTGGHGADDEFWVISAQDGTRYYFGWGRSERDKVQNNSDVYTHSVLTVPVAGNDTGEPCHAQFPEPCDQAWRWNLDRVVDANEVESTYFYEKQANRYRSWINTDKARDYDASSYLVRIEYGWASQLPGAQLPAKVELTHVGRCVERMTDDPLAHDPGACPSIWTKPSSYPDVPTDLMCNTGDDCKSITGQTASPTFFSTDMLWDIKTYVRGSDTNTVQSQMTWDPAMQYQMKYGLPDPSGSIGNQLWLDYVQRKGYGDGPDITLPTINFNGEWLDNQIGSSILNFRRVNQVHGDLGSFVNVTYGFANACDSTNLPSESNNDMDCFKQSWTPENDTTEHSGWFKKYLVKQVDVDPGVGKGASDDGDPVMTTTYDYNGKPAWAYPNDPLTPDDKESWTDWRGYQQVEIHSGTKANAASTYYWLYRGMDGDRTSKDNPSQTRSVSVTDGQGNPYPDSAWLNGKVIESSQRDGSGQSHQRVFHTYWVWDTAQYAGLPDARFVRDAKTTTDELVSGGLWRERVVEDQYDNDQAASTKYGLPMRTNDWGQINTDDNRCTTYGRAYNTSALFPGTSIQRWMVLPDETKHYAADCADQALQSKQDGYEVTLYDGATDVAGNVPTDGNATKVLGYADASTARETDYTYDEAGRVKTTKDANGKISTTTYNSPNASWPTDGVTVSSPDPDDGGSGTPLTTTTWYSRLWGNPYKIVDPNGNTTRIVDDSVGRISQVFKPTEIANYPDGNASMTFDYTIPTWTNPEGVPTLANGPPLTTTKMLMGSSFYVPAYSYADGLGRVRELQTPATSGGATVTSTRYDTSGDITGVSSAFHTDQAAGSGMVLPTVDTIPSYTDLLIDYAGRTYESRTLVNGDPQLQQQEKTNYNGDYTTTVPPSGERTNTYYDVFGQVTEVVEFGPSTYHTKYEYTRSGQLSKITDAKGNVTSYTYNWLGQRMTSNDPDTGNSSTTYNKLGLTDTTTDANGTVLTYGYDNLGRATTVKQGSTLLSENKYDTAPGGRGQLASATSYDSAGNAFAHAVDSYDADGRPQSSTTTIPDAGDAAGLGGSYKFGYHYNTADKLTAVDYPPIGGLPAETVTSSYDGLGRFYKLSSPLATYVDATDYDDLGRLVGRNYGSTSDTTNTPYTARRSYGYEDADGSGWLQNITTTRTKAGATSTVQNDTFTRDAGGQITKTTDNLTQQNECFTYDELNRLTQAWTTAMASCEGPIVPDLTSANDPYQLAYTYDGIGNLQKETRTTASGSTVRDYVYPGYSADQQSYTPGAAQPHGVASIVKPTGTDTYSYDSVGQLKSRTVDGVKSDLTWSPTHRVTSVKTGTNTTDYVYGPDGNVLVRKSPTESVLYLEGHEVRKSGPSVLATRYYTADGATVAMRTANGGNGVLTWLFSDAQSSTQLMIAAVGGTVTRRRYTPFGAPRSTADALPSSTDRGFLGKPEDDSTGLSILGARMYDPALGRFLSADPVSHPYSPQSLNAYTYSLNNPVNFSDPSGMDPPGTQGTCMYDISLCDQETWDQVGYDPKTGTSDYHRGCAIGDCSIKGSKYTKKPAVTKKQYQWLHKNLGYNGTVYLNQGQYQAWRQGLDDPGQRKVVEQFWGCWKGGDTIKSCITEAKHSLVDLAKAKAAAKKAKEDEDDGGIFDDDTTEAMTAAGYTALAVGAYCSAATGAETAGAGVAVCMGGAAAVYTGIGVVLSAGVAIDACMQKDWGSCTTGVLGTLTGAKVIEDAQVGRAVATAGVKTWQGAKAAGGWIKSGWNSLFSSGG
ncbi:RHS repeat-associated core domain-containing protein [Streptomyces sp. NPDC047085]|uniref:RHS repeat-associated core domain-containing protein n=1 Tax=Streptomyces sp. NPDC047085 TaxID=3155140 RepID=UPI0033C699AF